MPIQIQHVIIIFYTHSRPIEIDGTAVLSEHKSMRALIGGQNPSSNYSMQMVEKRGLGLESSL